MGSRALLRVDIGVYVGTIQVPKGAGCEITRCRPANNLLEVRHIGHRSLGKGSQGSPIRPDQAQSPRIVSDRPCVAALVPLMAFLA